MTLLLRDVAQQDLDAVLALNNAAGPGIVPIDQQRLRTLYRIARYFRVAEVDGHLAGFLVALTPEAAYDSPNFNWFVARYAHFVYIDRIVVAATYRRHGIGRVLFADVESFAEVRQPQLMTEVFIEPMDTVSMLFFGTQGFSEVGQQRLPNGHRVSLMSKPLESFDYVRERYLDAGVALPESLWRDRLYRLRPLSLSA